ncbi:hypothetical protein Hypma_007850 [Hypsizygus marmoreus]|uniref:Uncharacterized protein n=1 Tax=Hypsizygus marmoreus TaxID=39966 RepID=A0A369JT92_HYPMA|nr:hypothetical protein Hypma_007850 [Hypsizygus marmoreus]
MPTLPPELIHDLNQAYFLHVLATDPAKVIPPGKSLLSMLARAPAPAAPSPLHAKVEKVVHKAFWDEALLSLSSPSPSVQLPRLKLLYSDLHDALAPLFPPTHPILLSLVAPLSPTSSPLHSTLALLKEILLALRQRCAPARDPDIDALLADLESPPTVFHPSTAPSSPDAATSPNPLAELLISTLKSLIALADVLKHDLTNTLLGAMSEAQLATVIRQEARAKEREIVLDSGLWDLENGGKDSAYKGLKFMKAEWKKWIGTDEVTDKENGATWLPRLIKALTSPVAVSCQPRDENANALPPQFFFTRPSLLYIQNYLQALVVAASLRPLARLPPATARPLSASSTDPPQPDFTSRVWSLLKVEIDRDEYVIHAQNVPTDPEETQTKIINLADEVIRARRVFPAASNAPEASEEDLRAAVERTLRLTDPVFVLLQGRLVRALEERVREIFKGEGAGRIVPERMRTGRVSGGSAGSRGLVNGSGHGALYKPLLVKGFEDEVLAKGIEEVVQKIIGCVVWVEGVWGDTMSL